MGQDSGYSFEPKHLEWSRLQDDLEKKSSSEEPEKTYKAQVSGTKDYLNGRIGKELTDKLYSMTDKIGYGIDDGIKPLVGALWKVGYSTEGSCEGHLEWGRKYPWIDISAGKDVEKLKHILERYNSSQDVKWELVPLFYSQVDGERKVSTYQLKPVSELVRTAKDLVEARPWDFPDEASKNIANSEDFKVPEGIYKPLPKEEMPEAHNSILSLTEFILEHEKELT